MVHPADEAGRLQALEMVVMGQQKDAPGLLMRVDRLEQFTKLLIGLAALGVAWKVLDIAAQVISRAATPP